MTTERFQWLVLALLTVGCIGLGGFLQRQQAQLRQEVRALKIVTPTHQDTIPSTSSTATNAEMSEFFIVRKIPIVQGSSTFFITHRCDGVVHTDSGPTNTYCLGRNQLISQRPDGQELVISDEQIDSAERAPLLVRVERPVNADSDLVLLSYSENPCVTVGDCGVGSRTNFVSHAYSLSTNEVRILHNYPARGKAFWNPSTTKAVIIPLTCGGAGCGQEPLTGYSLADDTVSTLTREIAAGDESGLPLVGLDGGGTRTWMTVEWTSNDTFRATVDLPSGKQTLLNGTF